MLPPFGTVHESETGIQRCGVAAFRHPERESRDLCGRGARGTCRAPPSHPDPSTEPAL